MPAPEIQIFVQARIFPLKSNIYICIYYIDDYIDAFEKYITLKLASQRESIKK